MPSRGKEREIQAAEQPGCTGRFRTRDDSVASVPAPASETSSPRVPHQCEADVTVQDTEGKESVQGEASGSQATSRRQGGNRRGCAPLTSGPESRTGREESQEVGQPQPLPLALQGQTHEEKDSLIDY